MRHRRAEVGRVSASPAGRPVGSVTRGTTGPDRLRRADRWMAHRPEFVRLLTARPAPLVVDLGYGDGPGTTVTWARALRAVAPDVRVVGLEIDPARVLPPTGGVEFGLGGFELAGLRPQVVRAFNVLRQYPEEGVAEAWELVTRNLAPGGLLLEGTCDELGRRCAWVVVDRDGPRTLTLAWDPAHTGAPGELAERLPKALIHRNVPGEPVHELLRRADRAWRDAAPWETFGPRQRWRRAHEMLRERGVPLEPLRPGVRDNLLTVPWSEVAPTGSGPG